MARLEDPRGRRLPVLPHHLIGLPDGVELFERRSTTRQIRLAVSALRLETL